MDGAADFHFNGGLLKAKRVKKAVKKVAAKVRWGYGHFVNMMKRPGGRKKDSR